MKVYRGFNKEIGPISYDDWIYVTEDPEQAKWYATKDGDIKDGAIIEYDMYDDLTFLSLEDVNERMEEYEDETYTIEDLLWYQEGLSDYLYNAGAGIKFEDPYTKGHMIYILFSDEYIKNGRVLSKEEFDAINPKVFEELNDILRIAGVQLNEELIYAEKDPDDNEFLTNEIWKNPTRKELRDISESRIVIDDNTGDFYFCLADCMIHDDMIDKINKGDNSSIFYDYYKNTFYKRDEWKNNKEYDEMKNNFKEDLLSYPYIKNNFSNFKVELINSLYQETPW